LPVSRREESHRRINAELAQEKAAALGRAGERLEAALADATELGRRLDLATTVEEEARRLAAYESARLRAVHARTALLIQREALGLRNHRIVDQQYPEPPKRIAARPAR
jgi:hypothetical protein